MKALTLWRPWAHSILYLGKRIENRPWLPPASTLGQRIALHAGKTWDYDGARYIRAEHPSMPPTEHGHPLGIVGVATVRVAMDTEHARLGYPEQAVWIFGPFCWVLEGVIALPKPIACKGAQGLWPVAADIERQVNEALAAQQRALMAGCESFVLPAANLRLRSRAPH